MFCRITNELLPGLLVTTTRSGRVALPVTWPLVIDTAEVPTLNDTGVGLKLTASRRCSYFEDIDRTVGVEDRDVKDRPTAELIHDHGDRVRDTRRESGLDGPCRGVEDGDGGAAQRDEREYRQSCRPSRRFVLRWWDKSLLPSKHLCRCW